MSEHDSADRTEAPSPRRSQQAYEEGNVPVSRDLVGVACLAAAALALNMTAGKFLEALTKLFWTACQRLPDSRTADLAGLLATPALLAAAVCGAVTLAGTTATVLQTRFGFWPELALPRLDRLFSGGRLGRLFRRDTLEDMGLVSVKIVTLGALMWSTLSDEFVTLPRMLHQGPDVLLTNTFAPVGRALVKALAVLAVVAGADLALTRFRHRRRLKMTKEELKREMREEDGDPVFRSKRRRKYRELVKGRIAVEVPRADVVVVNPTHIAVALRYRASEDRAPRVTAKGQGVHAERIRELAREHGVPVVENVPLARLLYERVKVGRAVPSETFKAVAALLAFVYRALGRKQVRA